MLVKCVHCKKDLDVKNPMQKYHPECLSISRKDSNAKYYYKNKIPMNHKRCVIHAAKFAEKYSIYKKKYKANEILVKNLDKENTSLKKELNNCLRLLDNRSKQIHILLSIKDSHHD